MYSSMDGDGDGDGSSSSLPEDIIVAGILPRLLNKPLFRFKCVSRRYNSIISDLKFAPNNPQSLHPSPRSWASSGMYTSLLFPFTDLSPEHNVKDLTDTSSRRPICASVSLPHDNKSHRILSSSNGLLLSIFDLDYHRGSSKFKFGLCVSNPLTKQCVTLPYSPTLTRGSTMYGFGIATRRGTYKIVTIEADSPLVGIYENYENSTVQIFSSDTGSWVSRVLSCPVEILCDIVWKSVFAYKGILHLLDRGMGNVITYDPFDSPDRFGRIPLPKESNCPSSYASCLVYSGEQRMLKYCEVEIPVAPQYDTNKVSVWRLVDSGKKEVGEWYLECKFEVREIPRFNMRLLVAPIPWKRYMLFYPCPKLKDHMVFIDPRQRNWGFHKVVAGTKHEITFEKRGETLPFVFIQTCPWASPFYAQPQGG